MPGQATRRRMNGNCLDTYNRRPRLIKDIAKHGRCAKRGMEGVPSAAWKMNYARSVAWLAPGRKKSRITSTTWARRWAS